MYYMETGSTVPYYNLAFEEYVLTHCIEEDILLLWQNDNTIVVGQNQNTEAEINHRFVEENGIHVVRRSTGGGAVYHDLGNLNYSFITNVGKMEEISLLHFMRPVAKALQQLGLHVDITGRNDILVEGRKVSGTAQRLYKNRILHHGTLLFDSNLDIVANALKVEPDKFCSKNTKSIRSRVGNIREYLKEDMTLQAFWEYLKNALSETGVKKITLEETAQKEILELQEKKYNTWEWNFGKTNQFSRRNKKHFPGGSIEALLLVEKGIIKNIQFIGDFLSRKELQEVYDTLIGCRYEKDAVCSLLEKMELKNFFGSITLENIQEVLFY